MTLDPDVCYRALQSRDARFDGRIFVGVTSTGIYCRPICPARTPKRANVRFYAHAAAAAEAGFRPCLRCRPEVSPETPAWRGTSATVTRALRLIAEGALDAGDVPALAERLGVGERHLRRLFHQHLGASPIAVLQTRRVHLAKKLIDETALPLTEVALASGFGSVRRFNASMRDVFGRAPRELRRGGGARRGGPAAPLELELHYRPPFDWAGILRFLAFRAIPGVEAVTDERYRRAVRLGDASGVVEVRQRAARNALVLRVPPGLARHLPVLVGRVRRLFDLAADPETIHPALSRDPLLREILARAPGLRVPGAFDGFELAVRAILGQQVRVAHATALAGRLVTRYGTSLDAASGDDWRAFPTPGVLARARTATLGMPGQRAAALRRLAAAVHRGALDLDTPTDPARTWHALIALPGIGPWTASYIAMRALGEPDAFPSGDLVLRQRAGDGVEPLSAGALAERAQAWRPWRAYAAVALWSAAADAHA